jgi:peptidyl-prolyl cis-trans isomerase B (cyclophilin B)
MLRTSSPRRSRTWLWLALATVAALLISFGVGRTLLGSGGRLAAGSGSPQAGSLPAGSAISGSASTGSAGAGTNCTYVPAPVGAPQERKAPMPPSRAAATGTVRLSLATTAGAITLKLAADSAPCTVNSFVSLARSRYFDSTPCHRLTTRGIYVLQCGDPSGSGTGGPGYQYSDENLPVGRHPAYPRGTVAMANAGPNTNGSQFFLVFSDSEIDPNYSVVGTITGGLDVLDKIAAAGTDNSGGTGDGQPKLAVTINTASVGS